MCDLKSIRKVAKHTRRTWLRNIKSRHKRRLISRLRVNKAYKLKDQNILVITRGFGFRKVSVEIIASENPKIKTGQTAHISYTSSEKMMIPVPQEELPLYVSLDHNDLFNDLLLEA